MKILKIVGVIVGWLFSVAILFGVFQFASSGVEEYRGNKNITAGIWLPKAYTQGNKLPDGTYAEVSRVSFNDTTVQMPFGDAFKKLTENASQNVVIIESTNCPSVNYLSKINGVTYYAEIIQDGSGFIHSDGIKIISDDKIEWLMVPDGVSILFSRILVFIFAWVVILYIGENFLWDATKELLPKPRQAIHA